MWCHYIWSNIILGVYVRVFWMRLIFELVDLEQITLPAFGGHQPISWRPEKDKKVEWEESPPAWLFELDIIFFLSLNMKSQLFLRLEPAGFWTGT